MTKTLMICTHQQRLNCIFRHIKPTINYFKHLDREKERLIRKYNTLLPYDVKVENTTKIDGYKQEYDKFVKNINLLKQVYNLNTYNTERVRYMPGAVIQLLIEGSLDGDVFKGTFSVKLIHEGYIDDGDNRLYYVNNTYDPKWFKDRFNCRIVMFPKINDVDISSKVYKDYYRYNVHGDYNYGDFEFDVKKLWKEVFPDVKSICKLSILLVRDGITEQSNIVGLKGLDPPLDHIYDQTFKVYKDFFTDDIDYVIASDLLRSRQTASLIMSSLEKHPDTIYVMPCIHELNRDACDGDLTSFSIVSENKIDRRNKTYGILHDEKIIKVNWLFYDTVYPNTSRNDTRGPKRCRNITFILLLSRLIQNIQDQKRLKMKDVQSIGLQQILPVDQPVSIDNPDEKPLYKEDKLAEEKLYPEQVSHSIESPPDIDPIKNSISIEEQQQLNKSMEVGFMLINIPDINNIHLYPDVEGPNDINSFGISYFRNLDGHDHVKVNFITDIAKDLYNILKSDKLCVQVVCKTVLSFLKINVNHFSYSDIIDIKYNPEYKYPILNIISNKFGQYLQYIVGPPSKIVDGRVFDTFTMKYIIKMFVENPTYHHIISYIFSIPTSLTLNFLTFYPVENEADKLTNYLSEHKQSTDEAILLFTTKKIYNNEYFFIDGDKLCEILYESYKNRKKKYDYIDIRNIPVGIVYDKPPWTINHDKFTEQINKLTEITDELYFTYFCLPTREDEKTKFVKQNYIYIKPPQSKKGYFYGGKTRKLWKRISKRNTRKP